MDFTPRDDLDQRADLERVMGGAVELDVWPESVRDMTALAPSIAKADAVAAVLPLDLMAELLALSGGKMVLRSVSGREPTGAWRVLPDGRREPEFAFSHRY